ncbi:Outer membrane protein TolC precursor [Luteitalea pratensis]|uniref:Outer membrane protein TolC n=1 Tax=Luteitalea pratensis TaxID=1855912 RepID=A0A143PML9_LUTPR|nr:TolC family protein [Luteitalea pratensis]AMY09328.1 Outer membrane protein TolC precursor [Luteitalea pratensis]
MTGGRLRTWAGLVVLCMGGAGLGTAFAQTPLTLEDAIRRAQGDTSDARALASSIEEAHARIQRAQAGYWPRVDLAETIQRGNQPVYVFSSLLSQRRFTAANFAIPELNHPDPITNTRTVVSLEQPVYNAGLTRLGVQAATLERDLATATRDTARQDLGFRAAQAFVRVLQLEANVRAADAAVTAAESDRQRAHARREVGLVTDADVLAVDVQLADMRQRHIAAAGDLDVGRLQLAEAVGLPLTASIVPIRPASRPAPADGDALVQEALTRHPQLLQSSIQLQLAENARRTARAGLLPTVSLQGGWEFNGATLGAQQSSWVFGAEVRVNVFRGFADSARTTEAKHAHARAIAERERVERRIELGVRGALTQFAAARAREEAGRTALRQARESQRIIRDRYEGGLATVTDVLRAAEAALEAESRATNADMDVILQTVALERALGRI